MEPFYIIGNMTEPLFKMIFIAIKEMFFSVFDKVNVMKTFLFFFLEIDGLSTSNLGCRKRQDWQLCSEFTAEFSTNVAFRKP